MTMYVCEVTINIQ